MNDWSARDIQKVNVSCRWLIIFIVLTTFFEVGICSPRSIPRQEFRNVHLSLGILLLLLLSSLFSLELKKKIAIRIVIKTMNIDYGHIW